MDTQKMLVYLLNLYETHFVYYQQHHHSFESLQREVVRDTLPNRLTSSQGSLSISTAKHTQAHTHTHTFPLCVFAFGLAWRWKKKNMYIC